MRRRKNTMASSSDIFSRLQSQMFRRGSSSDESEPDRQPPRVDPATSRVKRCLFGRGNTEENIKFAKRELEKSLLESKKKWNFDFEHERPLEGRFEWQTSPYPKLLKAKSSTSSVASENVENLQPDSSSRKDLEDKSLSTQHLQHTSTSSSDERICDQPRLPEVAQGAKESSSSSASSASSLNQRSARQSAINQIYRQRKRSKSKVKTQERKPEAAASSSSSSDPELANAASAVGGTTSHQDQSD